jgi:hypothetical protein
MIRNLFFMDLILQEVMSNRIQGVNDVVPRLLVEELSGH